MTTNQPRIVGDSFALGYRFQRYWSTPMASAFFFGELGAGLFIVSLFYDVVPGMIAGLIATGVLKPWFHLSHMGVPGKSWRAALRPDRSWISRGTIAIAVFLVFGIARTILQADPGSVSAPVSQAVAIISVLGAVGVVLYHGLSMSHSTAISFWSTGMMPVIGVAYALLGGAAVTTALGGRAMPAASFSLHATTLILLAVTGLVLFSLIHAARNGAPGARVSMDLLLKGPPAGIFVPVVIGVGLLLPLFLLVLAPAAYLSSLLVAASTLAGFYAFRVLVFRAGVYDPIMSFAPNLGVG
ncbi:MAG TPA: NrfD/PsrC family molybdoenzyme membrane anchor subunit [Woeseiaceae bacterium]|jgi:formate-dependent nitrite reductase membrane component NrfD|nr:NrfD/PsrC family molybdoenzyme membrane anchor subunit [Woeseiaceae bacterium]